MKLKIEKRKLQALYDQIPKMRCIPGCTGCCGTVVASRAELQKAPKLAGGMERTIQALDAGALLEGCLKCPYSQHGNCDIYEDRPLVCRLYGTAPEWDEIRCPYGAQPEHPLTKKQAEAIHAEYMDIVKACMSAEQYREQHARACELTQKIHG